MEPDDKELIPSIPRPESQRLDEETVEELRNNYDEMKKGRKKFQRFIFLIIFKLDKTVFAVSSGAVTGWGASTLSNLLNMDDVVSKDKLIVHIFRLIFTLLFTVLFVLFSSKIIKVQESGSDYMKSEYFADTAEGLRNECNTLIYLNGIKSMEELKKYFCLSAIFFALMIVSYLFGYRILSFIREVAPCLSSLLTRFTELL